MLDIQTCSAWERTNQKGWRDCIKEILWTIFQANDDDDNVKRHISRLDDDDDDDVYKF